MILVILPGMDGTGKLLASFVKEVENRGTSTRVVTYPPDEVLTYDELMTRVSGGLPGNEEIVLLGESFSGPIALSLAQRKTPGVIGLVLVVTFAEPPKSLLLKMTRVLPLDLILRLPIPCWMARKLMTGEMRPKPSRDMFCNVIKELSPEVIAERIEAVRELRLGNSMIELPSIYIQASKDNLLPKGAIDGVRRLVPGVVVHIVDGPHLLLDTRPAECAEIVTGFMEGLANGRN